MSRDNLEREDYDVDGYELELVDDDNVDPSPDLGWLAGFRPAALAEPVVDDDKGGPTAPAKSIDDRLGDVQVGDAQQNVTLKKHLAYSAFAAVGLQLLLTNIAFFWYGISSRWSIEPQVMISWMATTVVETLGVVFIIARHLFPNATSE